MISHCEVKREKLESNLVPIIYHLSFPLFLNLYGPKESHMTFKCNRIKELTLIFNIKNI